MITSISPDPTPIEAGAMQLSMFLRDEPDHCLITDWPVAFVDDPGVVYADTLADLADLVFDLDARWGHHNDPERMWDEIRHEGFHGELARRLGFADIRYGLWSRVDHLPDAIVMSWQVLTNHIGAPEGLTKIDFAMVLAAPPEPSTGDRRAIDGMGYAGAEDVRQRWARRGRS